MKNLYNRIHLCFPTFTRFQELLHQLPRAPPEKTVKPEDEDKKSVHDVVDVSDSETKWVFEKSENLTKNINHYRFKSNSRDN